MHHRASRAGLDSLACCYWHPQLQKAVTARFDFLRTQLTEQVEIRRVPVLKQCEYYQADLTNAEHIRAKLHSMLKDPSDQGVLKQYSALLADVKRLSDNRDEEVVADFPKLQLDTSTVFAEIANFGGLMVPLHTLRQR